MFYKLKLCICIFMILLFQSCGGNVGEGSADVSESINTTKLIGTPFEGLITGDGFDANYFLCGRYQTTTIDSFPIFIFTVFFTPSEEEIIQEGIDMANDAMGFSAYEITQEWFDGARVIYKVLSSDTWSDTTIGQTYSLGASFQYQYDPIYLADYQIVDWTIELTEGAFNYDWVVAHELGHATGLQHNYFSFDTFEHTDLEENSIMEPSGGSELNDYNEMMGIRGEIMNYHLGQMEYVEPVVCP